MLRSALSFAVAGAFFVFSSPAVSTAGAIEDEFCEETSLTDEGCCPTYDANVDCWSGGHWHYNHCKNACTVENR